MDYTSAENKGLFLEGTGSMVFDRLNKKAYCSISERTNEHLIYEFCNDFEYMPYKLIEKLKLEHINLIKKEIHWWNHICLITKLGLSILLVKLMIKLEIKKISFLKLRQSMVK